MKTFLMMIVVLGFAVSPVPAQTQDCAAMHKQVMDAADYRLDDAAYKAKQLAAEGAMLEKAGKQAECAAKYDEAAKTMGIMLTQKAK